MTDSRAEFEKWCKSVNYPAEHGISSNHMWIAWQAAGASEKTTGKGVMPCVCCKRDADVTYYKSWTRSLKCNNCGFSDTSGMLGEPFQYIAAPGEG